MTDRRGRTVGLDEITQPTARAHNRVRTADPNLPELCAAGAAGVEFPRQPAIEARREPREHVRHEVTVRRTLRDDPLDASVEVTGAAMENRYHHRAGTWTVSPALTRSDSFAPVFSSFPAIMRWISGLFFARSV